MSSSDTIYASLKQTALTEEILKSTITKSKWKVKINKNKDSNFSGEQKLDIFVIGLALTEKRNDQNFTSSQHLHCGGHRSCSG